MTVVETRAATEADFDFLVDLHQQTFRGYVEQNWSWDEARQRKELYEDFHAFPYEVVCARGAAIGVISVVDQGTALFLQYIAILPTHQRQGLGTQLVRQLQAQALAKGVPVTLHVLKINPANALYERLGFKVTDEDEYRYFMRT